MPQLQILLATGNKKKRAEFERLFAPLGVELLPLPAGGLPDTIEDLPSFAGNAEKKAREAALAFGVWALADDSGLSVDALGGAPGVHSARFAGVHGDDAANNARLLLELDAVDALEPEARTAHFTCALCLCRPDGSVALAVEGRARGRILEEPRGDHDFGYDPLFLFTEPGFAETGKGFAELEPAGKGAVSHRGRALALLAERLPTLAT
jgi:XTP/dITP diphosphohydrolase